MKIKIGEMEITLIVSSLILITLGLLDYFN